MDNISLLNINLAIEGTPDQHLSSTAASVASSDGAILSPTLRLLLVFRDESMLVLLGHIPFASQTNNVILTANNHLNRLPLPNEPPITLTEKINLLRPRAHNPLLLFKRAKDDYTSQNTSLTNVLMLEDRFKAASPGLDGMLERSLRIPVERGLQRIMLEDRSERGSERSRRGLMTSLEGLSNENAQYEGSDRMVVDRERMKSKPGAGVVGLPLRSSEYGLEPALLNPTFNRLAHMASLSTVGGGISDLEDEESVFAVGKFGDR